MERKAARDMDKRQVKIKHERKRWESGAPEKGGRKGVAGGVFAMSYGWVRYFGQEEKWRNNRQRKYINIMTTGDNCFLIRTALTYYKMVFYLHI